MKTIPSALFRTLTPSFCAVGVAAMIAGPLAQMARAENQFADIIRKTDPLTPAEEQKTFHLPPGFKIELVAAEPDIAKPINMAFDAKGQLWVSQSREYPFPAPADKPARDAIKILSDFNTNGMARSLITFASGLNIPIGVYPYKSGALAYSIPNIYKFECFNHGMQSDSKELFLGRFGFEKDTHGMTSSFRRGYDGWLYANHGFNNTSVVTAKDGSSITMHSGNTYRVKIDGSHIEQYAWGRVNPFGLIFDSLGNLYSSDCETLPIYQILRGGYYPSFGKPDDGLGFAPPMMDHKHGSTAIAGIVYYSATNFPAEFRDNIFVGNVMTCRIDRDSLEVHGSTRIAREQPDFLSTTDPWFRPVDIQQGPDGAMYVADFYNRIIGHYEVPLDNPGRDRERGRIWRISYVGTNGLQAKVNPLHHFDLSNKNTRDLIKALSDPNLTVRMLAMSELSDRIGAPAVKPLKKMLRNHNPDVFEKIHGLWVLYRLNALPPDLLADMAESEDNDLRVHALRVLGETPNWTERQRALVVAALHDRSALARRVAADALGHYPRPEYIRPLLDARERVPADDTHLLYVVRMALRNQLLDKNAFAQLPFKDWSEADENAITDVCRGVPASASANFLLHHLEKYTESREACADYLRHIARYLPENETQGLVAFINRQFSDDVDFQLALYKSVTEGIAERGGQPDDSLREWGTDLAGRLAIAVQAEKLSWYNTPIEGAAKADNPWTVQERRSADGLAKARFVTSLPNESLTGTLRSKPFTPPGILSFFMAGHNGPPHLADQKKNLVRLCDAGSGQTLMVSYPPRNDEAHEFIWDLAKFTGKKVYFEIVDADTAGAYAWIAVGRFKPDVISAPLSDPRSSIDRQMAVAQLVKTFKLKDLGPCLAGWTSGKTNDANVRAASAEALVAMDPEANVALLAKIASDPGETSVLREKMAQALATVNSDAARDGLLEALRLAPDQVQVKMALALAGANGGSEMLLDQAEEGKISPRLLMRRAVKERMIAEKPNRYDQRFTALTKSLPPEDEQLQKVLDKRRAEFDPTKANAEMGARVFAANCMVCHSMDNKGGAVGPHLDGVGNRGLARLVEDVLDPSRNVDPSFRYSTVTLKDGDVFAGLQRREEGAVVVFVDATGKEIPVAKSDIAIRVESTASLMPDNFSEAISQADFNNLMAFLMSKGSGDTAKK